MPWAIFACKVINVDVLREALDAYQSLCHKDYHLKIGSVHQELLDISFFSAGAFSALGRYRKIGGFSRYSQCKIKEQFI